VTDNESLAMVCYDLFRAAYRYAEKPHLAGNRTAVHEAFAAVQRVMPPPGAPRPAPISGAMTLLARVHPVPFGDENTLTFEHRHRISS